MIGTTFFDVAPDYDLELIGKNLERIRIAAGFTRNDVADYFCISYQVVWKWENGICLPQSDKMLALLEFYHANVHDVIGRREEDRESSSRFFWNLFRSFFGNFFRNLF